MRIRNHGHFALSTLLVASLACTPAETLEAPPIDGGVAGPVEVVLSPLSATFDVGAALPLAWSVSATEAYSLRISLQAPGVPRPLGTDAWLQSGTAPATGGVHWLNADGTWGQTPTDHLATAASGERSVTLPTEAEGEWRILAQLVDAAGEVAALATASVLVASKPTVLLAVNRLHAIPESRIRVQLAGHPGSGAPVTLTSWLTRPDGATRSLPGEIREPLTLAEQAPTLELLDGALGGPGAYRINVRMSDADTGRLLGHAEAQVLLCDGNTSLGGRVTLGTGAAAADAHVHLLQAEDGLAYVAVADAEGRFATKVPAGRYLIHADAETADGLHSGAVPGLVVVTCAAASNAIDLTLPFLTTDPPGQPLEGGDRVTSVQPLQGSAAPVASDGLPRPRLFFKGENLGFDPKANLHIDAFPLMLRRRLEPDVTVVSMDEVRQRLSLVAGAMTLGGEGAGETLEEVIDALGGDFLVTLTFEKQVFDEVTHFTATARVVEPVTRQVVRGYSIARSTPAAVLDEMPKLLNGIVLDGAKTTLLRSLRDAQPTPLVPKLELVATPSRVEQGGVVAIEALLSEACNGAPAPAKELRVVVSRGGSPVLDTRAQTDASGRATFSLPSGTTPGILRVEATYERTGLRRSQVSYVEVTPPVVGAVRLASTRAHLHTADRERVTVRAVENGTPLARTTIALEATRGEVDTAAVRTDADGLASFEFIAGAPGPARVVARHDGHETSLAFYVEAPATIEVEATPFAALVGGGLTSISSHVTIGGAPVPGVTVEYALAGEGRLADPRALTDGLGRAAVAYGAPDQGAGSASIVASIVVDGVRYEAETVVTYDASCTGCPIPISPSAASVPKLGTVQFSAAGRVSWSATGGTIDGSGRFTAFDGGGLWRVTATSLADSSRSGTATVLVECDRDDLLGDWHGPQDTTTGTCGGENVTTEFLAYPELNESLGMEFVLLRGDPALGCRNMHSTGVLSGCRLSATEYRPGDNCALAEWSFEPSPEATGLGSLVGHLAQRVSDPLASTPTCELILETTFTLRR